MYTVVCERSCPGDPTTEGAAESRNCSPVSGLSAVPRACVTMCLPSSHLAKKCRPAFFAGDYFRHDNDRNDILNVGTALTKNNQINNIWIVEQGTELSDIDILAKECCIFHEFVPASSGSLVFTRVKVWKSIEDSNETCPIGGRRIGFV